MTRIIILSLALAFGFAATGASADSSQDTVRRSFVKNRQVKWQTVRADAPHALSGQAESPKSESKERAFRVAPRAQTGFRR